MCVCVVDFPQTKVFSFNNEKHLFVDMVKFLLMFM